MKTFLGLTLLFPVLLHAQKNTSTAGKSVINVTMAAEHWQTEGAQAEFVVYKNVPALKLSSGGVILKNVDFANGTIEFDTEPLDAKSKPFVSCYFRFQDNHETEVFYLRVGREHSEKLNDAVQYAPFIKGVNVWDLLPQYQGPSVLHNNNWNHIKLVISGKQMRAYVNNMYKPALEVPYLEGNAAHGSIALEGYAAFANLVIKPDVVEDLPAVKGVDLTDHDANYIRKWSVTIPVPLQSGELTGDQFPKPGTTWDSLHAERNGLINVTRKYGVENRRYVWLKANIKSAAELQRKLELGFSDEVWVFVNRKLIHADKNLYLQGMRKNPDGRCSILNTSMTIPLKPGDNELLIGLANDFYGWGIIARLDDISGLDLTR